MTLHGLLGYLVFDNILPAIFNDYNYTGTSLNGIRPPLIVWIQFIGITVWENCYWQRLILFECLLFPFPSRMSFVEFCSDQAPQFRSQAHCRCFSRKHKAGRSGCDMFYIWSLEAYCSLLSFPVWGRPQTRHSFFDILFCLYLDFQACVGYEIKMFHCFLTYMKGIDIMNLHWYPRVVGLYEIYMLDCWHTSRGLTHIAYLS